MKTKLKSLHAKTIVLSAWIKFTILLQVKKVGSKYICKLCNYAGSALEIFRAHLAQHRPGNPFQCPTCSKEFGTLGLLNTHRKTHLDAKTYSLHLDSKRYILFYSKINCNSIFNNFRHKCSTCNKSFKTRNNLSTHVKVIHSKPTLSCKHCKKMFRIKTNLNAHLLVHAKNREQYECEYCDMKFISRVGWFHHTKRHEGVQQKRRHKCYFCGFAVSTYIIPFQLFILLIFLFHRHFPHSALSYISTLTQWKNTGNAKPVGSGLVVALVLKAMRCFTRNPPRI